jgi:WD40 repeat protein
MVKHHRSKHTKKRSRSVKRSFKCGKKVKKQTRKTKTKIKTKNIVTYKKCGGNTTPIFKHIPMAFSSTGDKVVYGESCKKGVYYNHTERRDYQYKIITVHRAHVMCALPESDYIKCPSSEPGRYLQHISHDVTVRSVALRPKRNNDDGMVVMATGDDSGSVRIWAHMPTSALYEGKLHTRVHYNVTRLMVSSVAFSPDGTKVVAGFSDGTAHIWQERFARDKQMWGVKYDGTIHSEHTIMSVEKGKVTSVAFNHDGTKVVAGYDDGTARIWEVKDRRTMEVKDRITTEPMMIMMHNSSSNSVAFSPDGEKVVAGYHDGTVIIWDVKPVEEPDVNTSAETDDNTNEGTGPDDNTNKGTDDNTNKGTGAITSAGTDDNNNGAVPGDIASEKNEINGGLSLPNMNMRWLFNKKKKTPPSSPPPSYPLAKCLKKMEVHGGSVTSVAFSPDGKSVVSGSRDETVRIWDVESDAEPKKIPVDVESDAEPKKITVDDRTESSVNPRIVSSVAFTDNDNVIFGYHFYDGERNNDKIVCIFNVSSGKITNQKSIISPEII